MTRLREVEYTKDGGTTGLKVTRGKYGFYRPWVARARALERELPPSESVSDFETA